ncbi:K+-transporting ATPase ATPase C chain [Methanolinea mesophila]|uniref:potassium-transporting ATPase subunit KdpC n=1 Tax=Methanolinea mesophila TaxID=547055 RepID=UPI001AEA7BE1|nr:potassium-transporting ATPase subunit KdpC [Methanolinea mesophila]MBP1927748.1 K+-transporting ATPase ATPase C chain [Methanolinea mesophila]
MTILRPLRTAVLLFVILFVVVGVAYPLVVTLAGQALFPMQAKGSLMFNEAGGIEGSLLIGKEFSGNEYFIGRPSATAGTPYNASASGASNLGPTNPLLFSEVNETILRLQSRGILSPYPSDLVTSSGSGLDPHITLDAAMVQVPGIAAARGADEEELRGIVLSHAESGTFLFTQDQYVNVYLINLDLDRHYGTGRGTVNPP